MIVSNKSCVLDSLKKINNMFLKTFCSCRIPDKYRCRMKAKQKTRYTNPFVHITDLKTTPLLWYKGLDVEKYKEEIIKVSQLISYKLSR